MQYITSDTHFSHKFVAKSRGYTDVDNHDSYLMDMWNSTVDKGDSVYHLGDFAFIRNSQIKRLVNKLNGNIFLIRGNHDKFGLSDNKNRGFSWVKQYYQTKYKETKVVMFHYPIISWNHIYKGSVHFHGHCHGNLKDSFINGPMLDVGIDNVGKILSMDEAIEIALSQDMFVDPDHHCKTNKNN